MLKLAILVIALLASITSHAAERHPFFVDAAQLVPGLVVEMRYASEHNFVGARIDGYEQPVCLLTRQAAAALARVQRDLAERGLGLKVYDCYRPARAVMHFARWARDLRDLKRKAEFYPALDKRDLFRLGYIAAHSRHSSGSTVDITLVRRADGGELDMGTPFDLFGPRSWPGYPNVSAQARVDRALLAAAMQRRGFRPNAQEWWHFTLRGEPFAGAYFDFVVR